ncbi:MAG: ABC transporter permease [Oscillospiraceae bacterium]
MIKKVRGALGTFSRQVGLIIIALLFATAFLAISGHEPMAVVNGIWQSISTDFGGTLRWATPLILAGLAIAVTYKAEVFNLGVDGQLCMGAAASTVVALMIPASMNSALAVILCVIAAVVAGALYALIPAFLKVYTGTNEVVSTLLFNFLAALFIEFLVTGPLMDKSSGMNLNASPMLPENTWLPRLSYFAPSTANCGIYIALILVAVIAFMFYKTTLGHEIKMVGANPVFAKYAGMKPQRSVFKVMAISGGIAGLIGAIEVLAIQHRLLVGFNPGFGFDGIVVSLLANNNPIGVLFSGFFFGALKNGGVNMERVTDVPSAVTGIVMAIIIIIAAAKFTMPKIKTYINNKKANKTITVGEDK